MIIYQKRELLKPNFFQKLFRILPKENVQIEISNLFADNQESIESILPDMLLNIGLKYKVDFINEYKDFRLGLYKTYLIHCLRDENLVETELRVLWHLKKILCLNEMETKEILEQEQKEIYEKAFNAAISNGSLEEIEKENLERLKSNLFIPDYITENIYKKVGQEFMQHQLSIITSDKRLSPDEENELNEIGKRLGFNLHYDEITKAQLWQFRFLWQIENGDLPVIESDISLQTNETLHYVVAVKWLEQRRVSKRINYAGPTTRIRLAKGFYYRLGSIDYQNVSEDEWQIIDRGKVYLTNKRIIFMGSRDNKTILLKKILDFKAYTNGIDIFKDSGKSPFLEFSKDSQVFAKILARLL